MGTHRIERKKKFSLDFEIAREPATVSAVVSFLQRGAWEHKAVLPKDFILVLGITRRPAD